MSAAELSKPAPLTPEIDYPRIGLISFGHFMNDLYGGTMSALTPYLVIRHEISVAVAGLILLIYLFGSSILQPVFGMVSDRSGRRYFAVLGPICIGAAVGFFGWASGDLAVLALAAVGGIGTAAFHPQAASMIDRLSRRSKGWAMSIFAMGGNVGIALGPVVAATLNGVGLHWALVLLLPGILLTVLMAIFTPDPSTTDAPFDRAGTRRTVLRSWRPLSLIVGVIAIRSGAQFAFFIFLPLYYHLRGLPAELGSYYAFVLSISGAFGGLIGGYVSDRYGRKLVVVTSLLAATPLLFLSLQTTSFVVWPLLVTAGACLLASNSVTVVQGQELLPANTGVASGLTLGFGFGLSGVLTSALTTISGHIGVESTVMFVPLLPLLAAGLAALVPSTTRAGLGSGSTPGAAGAG